jgi:arginine decarboxylase
MLDVGGGLGVDYDGSQTNFHSSMNYTVQEYANDVVSSIQEACDETHVPHPDIITEAGRSMVAHHSVLIFDVLGVSELRLATAPEPATEDDPRVLQDLYEIWTTLSRKNPLEGWHDLVQLKEEAGTLFALGYLDLRARARVEKLYQAACEKLLRIVRELPQVPEELADLEKALADTYYGNFSMFQSMPDHWGFKQLFPVMPIHRLEQEPTRRGVIADLTCDSDGKIGEFIDQHDVRKTLELHALNGAPYYIAVFLVGAYQEILGDLHNLFGDTHAVHVRVDDQGKTVIEHVVQGDKVREVLDYVEYDRAELLTKVAEAAEAAADRGELPREEAQILLKRYEAALEETTYLSRE